MELSTNPVNVKVVRFDNGLSHLCSDITQLLHRAYKPLLDQGLRYTATRQSDEVTLERLGRGESYLQFIGDELIGTVTLMPAREDSKCTYYRLPSVFSFGQFAIDPKYQGQGQGSRMMDFLENRARELGAKELALDTSVHAHHLIRMYEKRGYQIRENVQWDTTNYVSHIMSKSL